MDEKKTREQILEAFSGASRELSTWTVLFHSVLAAKVGLNTTDHKCLDVLFHHDGPMTAGQLAEITGLTTGAVTGVIDRLEKVGYARRERDPRDRRKVLVHAEPGRAGSELGPYFDHLMLRYRPLLEQYNDEELSVILDYVRQSARFMQEEVDWLRREREK